MSRKACGIIVLFMILSISNVFAQNEASKDFVQGTVLAKQEGSSLDKFPKIEIGFIGRNTTDTGDPMAFLFFRIQSALETGGGLFSSYYDLNRNTNQLEKRDGNSLEQFISLLHTVIIVVDIAKMRDAAVIDMEIGEIEMADFQWYIVQNQWKYTRNKTCRIKVKVQTVNRENRLYFYRTSDSRDSRNEFETFTMPNDVYLTQAQCQRIIDAYDKENTFL